jgi:hypothetical protein
MEMKKFNLLALFFFMSSLQTIVFSQTMVINELMSSNLVSITDEDGSNNDWIELHNPSSVSINLLGYALTDDSEVLDKWLFPEVIIAPGGYLLVWASDKNRAVAGSPLHTNFKISASGETVILSNSNYNIVDSVPATAIPENSSYGRFPNATGGFVFFQTSTPGAINAQAGFSTFLNPPVFSENSGFFTTGFQLSITSTDANSTILYTLDGSEPDENNMSGTTYFYKNQYPKLPGQATGSLLQKNFQTQLYSGPIPIIDRTIEPNKISMISSTYDYLPPYLPSSLIYKGTVVKAKVIQSGALPSPVVVKNYFVSPQGNNRFTLPVLSLSLDENKLFDYTNGIYVAGKDFDDWRIANPNQIADYEIGNYRRSGIESERKAHLNYFVNGTEVLNQAIGIRIRGSYSRIYPSKSLNLYARSDYGSNKMEYPFFSDENYNSFSRVSLKSSSGDFYHTMFRDALNHELVKTLRMETEAYQPIITFLNGEYWGILGIREKYDEHYFNRVYSIAENEIDIIENEGDSDDVEEGDNNDYDNLRTYLQNNSLVSDANYSYIKTRLDPENFIDYFTTNIFAQNADWPGNNMIYWRKKTTAYAPNAPYGHDGRWRWAIHDMDSSFNIVYQNSNHNSLADATAVNGPDWPNPEWATLFLRRLLENNTFKIDFINRFADLLNTNFLSSRITSKIDEMKAVLAPEMNEQIARWKAPINITDWNYYINYEKDFANSRPAFQRDHIRAKFGIESNLNATLDVSNFNHGIIKISTIEIKDGTPGISGNPYPWTGIYFKNIPLKLKAIAKPGYIFSYWSGTFSSTDAEISIMPSGNFNITAHFIADPALAVDQNSIVDFSIYPNPFLEVISIRGVEGLANYKIYSVDGKLIKKGAVENDKIHLSELAKEMYLLQLDFNDKIMTKKIIKK